MSGQPIIIVQGGQYGSESKGAITGYLCQKEKVDIAIRTGAVNAGHTVMWKGEPVKMQQLPVGWVNPATQLVIGAGALVHLGVLKAEVDLVSRLLGEDIRERLFIDHRAGVHDASHTDRSTASGRHHAIGATGKGSSEALIDKIRLRGSGYQTFGMTRASHEYHVGDTAQYLNYSFDQGKKLLIEGTQGTLLDIHTGPYPYTTHKSTLPGAWMAECGLSPSLPTDIVMVVRTFPIRVAGNSGFMPAEISWPMLANEINEKRAQYGHAPIVGDWAIHAFEAAVESVASSFPKGELPEGSNGLDQHMWVKPEDREKYRVALSEINAMALKVLDAPTLAELARLFELTTVTKKLRRIARLSLVDLRRAGALVRPHRVAVTFMNYEFPTPWYTEKWEPFPLSNMEEQFLGAIEVANRAPVTMVSYGPGPEHIMERVKSKSQE